MLAYRGKIYFQRAAMADKLDIGDTFPTLTLQMVGGGTMAIPDALNSKYRVFLFYRGHW